MKKKSVHCLLWTRERSLQLQVGFFLHPGQVVLIPSLSALTHPRLKWPCGYSENISMFGEKQALY